MWGVYNDTIYDLTDYVWPLGLTQNSPTFVFLNTDLVDVFKQRSGQDVTPRLNKVLQAMNTTSRAQNLASLNTVFLVGKVDFRKTARCQVQSWFFIIFSKSRMASMERIHARRLNGRASPFISSVQFLPPDIFFLAGSKGLLAMRGFDDSLIPLKKFSEYEAEAWESGTRHSDDTRYDDLEMDRLIPITKLLIRAIIIVTLTSRITTQIPICGLGGQSAFAQ
ncbi:hypothetical protein BYT27DRAFT_7259300 [Phlegmacium glaucopus]|nr:hypothetical protein BYT27DRAFT_7259300 [Phlegmacium glaucopus]